MQVQLTDLSPIPHRGVRPAVNERRANHNTRRSLRWAVALAFACLLANCSSFRSEYYLEPDPEPISTFAVKKTGHNTAAIFTHPNFTMAVSVPFAGVRQHSSGPCLFPFLPNGREWPVSLKLEIELQAQDPTTTFRLYPGEWTATMRTEEFGKTFGGTDTFSQASVFHVFFYEGSMPRTGTEKTAGGWTRKGPESTKQAIELRGPNVGLAELGVFSNQFEDFVLSGMRVEVGGTSVALPKIQFRRGSRWRYIPYTTKLLDL